MARTTKIYPQQEGTVFPRELLEFAIDAAREGYVRTANMGAAFNMMKRQVKDRWTVEKGPSGYMFKEHVHPLESYLRPKEPPPTPREKPAAAESEAVADARKRWDAAKTAGDAGAMTRTANDLLRAVEADRAARGETAEGDRPESVNDVLAPPVARAEQGHENAGNLGEAAADAVARAAAFAPELDLRTIHHDSADTGRRGRADRRDHEALPQVLSGEAKARAAMFVSALKPTVAAEFSKYYGMRFGEDEARRLLDSVREPIVRAQEVPESVRSSVTVANAADDEDSRSTWDKIIDWITGDTPEGTIGPSHVRPDLHPDDPNTGLERIRRARARGRNTGRLPRNAEGRSHWADPDVGWTAEEMRDVLKASSNRPLTAEALLTWSSYVYPDEHRDSRGRPIPPHETVIPGWRVIAHIDDPASGYYGMAVYNPRTHEVVIVNRGTEFTTRVDEAAAIDIFQGKIPGQLRQAERLLERVSLAFQFHKTKPRIFATGHSLGGAAAQYQVALSLTEGSRFGGMQIYGVTFGAVGAADTVRAMLGEGGPGRRNSFITMQRKANERILNYVRVGDGIVRRRTGRRHRSEMFGRTVLMAGVGMEEIEEQERRNALPDNDDWLYRPFRKGSLESNYFENHTLKSYYSSDFLKPVDQLFPQSRR